MYYFYIILIICQCRAALPERVVSYMVMLLQYLSYVLFARNLKTSFLCFLIIYPSLLLCWCWNSGHFISPSCPTFFRTAGNENMALLLELYSVEGLCLCCWLWKRSCELMCLSVCCGDGTCDMKYSAILSWQPSWCCFFFCFWSFITFFFFLNDWKPFWRQEKRMVILLIW